MEEINHLIEKFWAGKASETEKDQLFQYLDTHAAAWQEYLREGYKQGAFAQEAPLSDHASARILQNLHEEIQPKVIPMRAWLKWAVAAMLILFAGGSVLYFSVFNKHVLTASDTPALIRHQNTGKTTETFYLPDGSQVKLEAGSAVSYYPQFSRQERNVLLEGAAFFHAAHDEKRPFSVTARNFKTTALGTSFYINTAADTISVKLIEGKVVVRAIAESGMAMRDVYLTPGEEFVVNPVSKQCRVQAFEKVAAQNAKPAHVTVLSFNRTNLAGVFRQLGDYYHMQIELDSTDISGLTFTGAFEQSDSPQIVLSAICSMNDLTYTQEGSRIIISKMK